MKRSILIAILVGATFALHAESQRFNATESHLYQQKQIMLSPNGLGRAIDAQSLTPFGQPNPMMGAESGSPFDGNFDNIPDPEGNVPGDWGDIDPPQDPVPLTNGTLALIAFAALFALKKAQKSRKIEA